MQATALNTLTAVSQVCALSLSFVKEQAVKVFFMLSFSLFFLIVLLFKTWMHAVPRKAITWKHIHKKLLKLTSRNVKIRSTLSSNKHWRFGLQASLFQNWSEYLQTGSCPSAVQYSITVKKERQSIDIAIPTHTYSFCLYGMESKGLFKQGFFFLWHNHWCSKITVSFFSHWKVFFSVMPTPSKQWFNAKGRTV